MFELTIEAVGMGDPNVMKFVTNKTLNPAGAKAFYDADEAAGDPVAEDFFAADGVAGLMILNEFCLVHKAAEAGWGELCPRIEAVIREHWG